MLQGCAGRGPPRDAAATSGGGGGGGGGGRDRISDLPDELRHHIFSFMPAWEVVRTSTLSRRWRHIWASAPCLDIHYPCACADEDEADEDGQDWYAQFVKHLLLKRRLSASFDTLRLHWNHHDANTWIAHAVRRNARAIELSGKHHPKLEPEYSIFLYGNLKILQLSHLHMNNDNLSQLCSRCTSLEELELKNVELSAMYIRSTSLKRLTMVRCVIRNGLSVDAPNLVLLRCIRPHNFIPGIENSGSLVTATIMLDDNCLKYTTCPTCANDEDPGHSESQSASDDNRTAGSDAEDSGHSESQSASDDNRSTGSDAEVPGNGDSQSEPADGSDAEDPDNNGHDGEIADVYSSEDDDNSAVSYAEDPENDGEMADVYSGEDDDNSAGSDAGDLDNSDDDDDNDEIAHVYSREDDCYHSPIYGGHGILHSLSNVITMNLSAHYGELVLREELKNCPELKNLRTLSLGEWCMDPDLNSLSSMLEKSPNLENLFIYLEAYSSKDKIYPRERSLTCNNLKVKISYSMRGGSEARRLENFFRAKYGSREKRKAQDEAAKSPAKRRKVQKSRSPEGGQGGRN
nr:RNIL [Avena sativa]